MAVEILGCAAMQISQALDTARPFIEGQNIIIAAPGFLAALLLWLYHTHRSKVLVVLSVGFLLLSSFILVALLLIAIEYGKSESGDVDELGVTVLAVYLVCNVVTAFQYRKE